jgi:hypothetical protein
MNILIELLSAYIVLQCFEILARPKTSFQSEPWRNWMLFVAVLIGLFGMAMGLGAVIMGMER